MRTLDSLTNRFECIGNNPSVTTEHTRDVGVEHVEGMVNGLLAEDDPSLAFSVIGQQLAKTVASILILPENGPRVNKFLCVLSQHLVDGSGIVHVGKRITMGREGVADLLELGLDTFTVVKDGKDRLLEQHAGFRVGDGLLNRSESNVHITTGGTEDHALKANLFLSRDNFSNG
jgi:hypothetical protein